jgi:DNA-binding LytR/AlgR family response regulator
MLRVLIIEDEVSARNHLLKLLQALEEDFEVVGSLGTVRQSLAWLSQHKEPDLVFMDIHLSDGISFDILSEHSLNCPIVFITAYDQYAIKAFKTMGIDYLLKPVSEEELAASLVKYHKLNIKTGDEWLLKNLEAAGLVQQAQPQTYQERFLLRSGTQFLPVKTEEIAWFYRKDELVYAMSFEGKSYFIDQALNQLQKVLDPKRFFRLNRQVLASLDAIQRLQPYKPGQVTVSLMPEYPEDLHLSQERSSRLKMILGDRS